MSMYGVSAYQQMNESWEAVSKTAESRSSRSEKSDNNNSAKETSTSNVKVKAWSPLDATSSLIPRKTEYGNTIGDVQLSDKAKDYYEKLKSKFGNMEFIVVSKDMKTQVAKNAAAYGNSAKQVVLIDEEKLERMAVDENYRKQYEGIISASMSKMAEARNSLVAGGANIKNFGMSVDSNGLTSFFAVVEKSLDLQKERIEKKAEEKKMEKAEEKKEAEKEEFEERIEETREYITFEADSIEELLAKVSSYSYENASDRVMTDDERAIGAVIDFRG